jgi:bacillithiol biosynthesis cysteine-adding enzyme BshC
MVRAFTDAWLADDPAALPFLPRPYASPTLRRNAVVRAAERGLSPIVADALIRQNAALPPSAAREAALATLANGRAAVVVTGQQTGLFGGPLYVLHKAATAIRMAETLARETGIAVVPVFWLQTEDADFEEIRAIATPGPDGVTTLRSDDALGDILAGERIPVAHRPLGPSVEAALTTLGACIGVERHGAEALALFTRHYRPDATYPRAFAGLLAELFAATPLVFIDPRDPALGALTRPVFAKALTRADTLDAALVQRAAALEAAGFKVQVHARPGASLVCHAPDRPDGPRYRLVRAGDGSDAWLHAGLADAAPVTTDRLLDHLVSEPLAFSTTALLRPALQDSLLPTAAYVGGPGEIAYFAQMGPVWDTFTQAPPLIVPRARLRLVTPTARRLAEQLGLQLSDDATDRAMLANPPVATAISAPDFAALRKALAAAEADTHDAAETLGTHDAGLAKAVRKAFADMQHQLDRLGDRLQRATLQADTATTHRLARLRALLAPEGQPQERTLGCAHFAAQLGPAALVATVLDAVIPFEHRLKDVHA